MYCGRREVDAYMADDGDGEGHDALRAARWRTWV